MLFWVIEFRPAINVYVKPDNHHNFQGPLETYGESGLVD